MLKKCAILGSKRVILCLFCLFVSNEIYKTKNPFQKRSLVEKWVYSRGAEGRARTGTGFPPLPPQDSVSTSSTTSAFLLLIATQIKSSFLFHRRKLLGAGDQRPFICSLLHKRRCTAFSWTAEHTDDHCQGQK